MKIIERGENAAWRHGESGSIEKVIEKKSETAKHGGEASEKRAKKAEKPASAASAAAAKISISNQQSGGSNAAA